MTCSDVNVFGTDSRTLANTPSNKTENCEYFIIHRFFRSPAITGVYIYESAEHRFRLLFRGLWLPLQNKRLTITPHPTDMHRSHEWPRNIKGGRSVRSSSFASENCHIHETGQRENTFANMYVGVTDTAKIYNILNFSNKKKSRRNSHQSGNIKTQMITLTTNCDKSTISLPSASSEERTAHPES